jgi:N-acetylglucosaminyldiphosphoundecaprenol N-acetyl-beta-D-mannosaminyltransferase
MSEAIVVNGACSRGTSRTPAAGEFPPAVWLAGLPVLPLTQAELVNTMVSGAKAGCRTTLHYVNVHVFNLARTNADLHRALVDADALYPDGMGIVWAARLLGYCVPERLSAADYFERVCAACAEANVSLFLLGGAAGVADVAADRLKQAAPGLRIAGTSHGYLTPIESAEVVRRINDSGAHIVVVGMDSPRQELWVAQHADELRVPVRWTVGALFDYFAGRERRAPAWMCRHGLEWLYRLCLRPGQRWRRYVRGNARFIGWLGKEWLIGSRGDGR